MILPLTELGKHGHDVTIGTAGTKAVTSRRGRFDIIVGQMLAAHDQSQLSTWRRLSAHGRLVYELDDNPFAVEQVNWQAYSTFARADVIDAVSHSAEVAALVTCTVEPLAKVMREHNPNVAVLPNCVPGWVCEHQRTRHARPRVGWLGGASHGRDIRLVARPVREFLNRNPGWDGHLIGTDFRPAIKHERIEFTNWVSVYADPRPFYEAIDFDIALAPLQWTVFASSKSYIKALEAAALGIPVIASDAEPYRDFVVHGVTGFLVRRDHEWLTYLQQLADDEGLRESMGHKAREHARAFTIENNWHLWEQAYGRLL
jgi:glycosyltransferase involved in cell wall biosynthesis